MSLAKRALAGDLRAAARLMRRLDDEAPDAIAELLELYPLAGRALLIGITGSPGAGKSTLCDALIEQYRARGFRVGVVAVDPTSPLSGGAILGDRIRMQRHATDDGVFIRSVATRGCHGGLSRSTADIVMVLDALGYERILIETVGVGQDEISVVSQAHVVAMVTMPGLGDEVQALKGGLLEVADIIVVNKADREGADRAAHDLLSALQLRDASRPLPPVIKTSAVDGTGLAELLEALESKGRDFSADEARQLERARTQVLDILRESVDRLARQVIGDDLVRSVAQRVMDPHTAARKAAAELAKRLPGLAPAATIKP